MSFRYDQSQLNVASLEEQIRRSGGSWMLHEALGDALFAAGRDEEAVGSLMNAVRLNPSLGSACTKIGRFYLSRGLVEPAVVWLRRALETKDVLDECVPALAIAEVQRGNQAQVAEMLDSWVAENPADPIRRHLAVAILGRSTPAKADKEYVTALFDDYACRFDESLAKLQYCGPDLVIEAMVSLDLTSDAGMHVLDVGCGTGLVGLALRKYSRRLVGIDLSPNMLQQAALRNVYDELAEVEMCEFMRSQPSRFDLVTAADVLSYTGDLNDFCSAMEISLRPGGGMIIVLEACDELSESPRYRLNSTGRFSHRKDYVRQVLVEHGLQIRFVSSKPMRYEYGKPASTLVVAAEKTQSSCPGNSRLEP